MLLLLLLLALHGSRSLDRMGPQRCSPVRSVDCGSRSQHFELSDVLEDAAAESSGLGGAARRIVGSLVTKLSTRPPVREQWMRYPAEPLSPAYYATLLATAVGMSEEEQRARAVMEPREPLLDVGAEVDDAVAVSIESGTPPPPPDDPLAV